jgi:hypothetical protein
MMKNQESHFMLCREFAEYERIIIIKYDDFEQI